MSLFKKILITKSYKSIYGSKAKINLLGDKIEVVLGGRKVIHNATNNKKIEETLFDENRVTVIKYNEKGIAELEEIYVDGEKVSESIAGDGKSTNVQVSENGVQVLTSKYFEDNEEVNETIYRVADGESGAELEVIVMEKSNEILKSIVKKEKDEVVLEIQKRLLPDGRITFYKDNDVEVDVSYYGDAKDVKRYSKHREEDVFEDVDVAKSKKSAKKSEPSVAERKKIGSRIVKEVIEYNEHGKIMLLDTNEECIRREFYPNGELRTQYNIISTESGKEIVGKLITEDKDIKIINNSTLNNDDIVKLNNDMDTIEYRYEDNVLILFDFEYVNESLTITEKHYQINSKLTFLKNVCDRIENGVSYHVEEIYKNGKLYATKKENKVSKTILYVEGNKYFVTGLDKKEKEVTAEEFELYKMADELNKV